MSSIPQSIESSSASKNPTTAKKRLHNMFGRKSSVSSSRTTSPRPDEDVPHLPTLTHIEQFDGTPRPTRHHSRPTSPTPLSTRTRQSHTNQPSATNTASTSFKLESIFKPTRLFAGSARRAQSQPPTISLSHPGTTVSPMPTLSSSNSDSSHVHNNGRPDIPVVSGPSRHASTSSRIARKRASTNESISSISSSHRFGGVQPAVSSSIPVPRITHTPATPASASLRPNQTPRKDSMESGYRYRPLVMEMVDEEKDPQEAGSKGKEKQREDFTASRASSKGKQSDHSSASEPRSSDRHQRSTRHVSPKPQNINLAHIRSAKHGSFDFERPFGGVSLVRTSSGTTSTSRAISPGRYSNRSGTNSASGAAIRRTDSSGRKKDTKVTMSSRKEDNEYRKLNAEVDDDPVPPYSPAPTTGPGAGLSSSLGRSSSKRSGIARLVGLGGFAAHGAFSFEPPVPSPISPTFSQSSHANNVVGRNESEYERRWAKERSKPHDSKEKWERAPQPIHEERGVSNVSGVRSRSEKKGRSLDLGIGLAWAPSKVREDVLFPSGVIFANAKGMKNRLSESTGGRTTIRGSRTRTANEFGVNVEDRSKVGRDVAEEFKKVLDPEGYNTFKKYVHKFDRHEISFDGENGIIAQAEKLLDLRTNMEEESKRRLINRLAKIVLQNA
ncbi:hypothetical protein D9757_001347 [Collybiopsis confluens]|uniref:Uncharacterized protein n=1 Tax=Collybiopsis confluens TaxID=2823264 RepID=A0A8H5I189_9AGAR|nr:hypothetical protein D9757_001347 [Collybiopsis confluens]